MFGFAACRACLLAIAGLVLGASLQVSATEVGGNGMDLLLAYRGQSSNMTGSKAELWTGTAMARRQIADAKDMGFKFMRVAVGGYGPSNASEIGWSERDDLTPWLTNPNSFWASMDTMFNDLDAAGVKIVPVLMWNPPQFPTLAHETISMMINGPSTSRLMAKSFIQSFLKRYASRSTILFVELTNEWNLSADLDLHGRCIQGGGTAIECAPWDDFTTAGLASFVTDMAEFIHYTAPGVLVSSGFALPRASAWHLAQTPEWSPTGPDWTSDTPAQFAENIAQLHRGLDIVSAHVYPGDVRFGNPAGTEGQTAADVAGIAHAIGKQVYIGEFGDSSASAYLASMWQGFASGQVDYASFWAVEFYQMTTTQLAPGYDLDPESTQPLNAYISSQIGAPAPDPSEPARVVLAAPTPCSSASVGQPITVVAHASGPGALPSVAFYLDGVRVAAVSTPPYQTQITVQRPELATIQAVVSNGITLTSTSLPVAVDVHTASCSVPSLTDTSTYSTIAPADEQIAEALPALPPGVATVTTPALANGHALSVSTAQAQADNVPPQSTQPPLAQPASFAGNLDAASDVGTAAVTQSALKPDDPIPSVGAQNANAATSISRRTYTVLSPPRCDRHITGPLFIYRRLWSWRCKEARTL